MPVGEELKTYILILWRSKWMIIACSVVAASVAFGISTQLPPRYSATAVLHMPSAPGGEADYIYFSAFSRLSNTYVEIANSAASLDEVAKRLGLQEQPNVEAEIVAETELIRINASDPDPINARDIANTLANLMVEQRQQIDRGNVPTAREILAGQLQQAKTDLDLAVSEYEGALRDVQSSPTDNTQLSNPNLETLSHILYVRQQIYGDLLQKYEEARTNELVYANAITVIEPADVPKKPSTPNLPLNTILSLVAGLAMGTILAFVFEGMDNTVRGIEDIETATTLPILCTIPEFKRNLRLTDTLKLSENGDGIMAQGFHQLRTRLILASTDTEPTSILFTSPEPGAGKSTVATSLAMSLAKGGNQVVLIDMDFHHPCLHSILNLPNEKGLSNFMCGDAQLEMVMQNTNLPNLRVITAGSRLDKPFEWLTLLKVRTLLQRLRTDRSYILIDTSAFLSVAEPMLIASQVDTVIVVVARRNTEMNHLHLTLQQLVGLATKVSGIVMNNMPNSHLYSYYSGKYWQWPPFKPAQFVTQMVANIQSKLKKRRGFG